MFDTTKLSSEIKQYIYKNILTEIKNIVADDILSFIKEYARQREGYFRASGLRIKLPSDAKVKIGMLMREMIRSGVKEIMVNSDLNKSMMSGFAIKDNENKAEYKISLDALVDSMEYEVIDQYVYFQIPKSKGGKYSQMADLYDLFLRATNVDTFYEVINNYIKSEQFGVSISKRLDRYFKEQKSKPV